MAIKPFAIQGADLTLGGVSLQAGTTGVVIPGVTRATNYKVEEVDDNGDQTVSFQSAPIIIDYVTYLDYDVNGSSSGRAEYTVEELDDDGYIDGISVDAAGTYTAQDSDRNKGNDMFAYTGTDTMPGIFVSFVSTDWTQIPFRPKMRAGVVELEGGGGGSGSGLVERTVNFPYGESGDTQGTLALTPGDEVLVCIADYVEPSSEPTEFTVLTSEGYNLTQSGDPGTLMSVIIARGDYPEIDTIMDTFGYQATGWQVSGNTTDGYVRDCVAEVSTGNRWSFTWTYVGGQDNNSYAQGEEFALFYTATQSSDVIWQKLGTGTANRVQFQNAGSIYQEADDAPGRYNIVINAEKDVVFNTDEGTHTFSLTSNGTLKFPDGSEQSTAATGGAGGSSGELYIMANVDGNIVTSTDGTTWSDPIASGMNGIQRVAIHNSVIVYIPGGEGPPGSGQAGLYYSTVFGTTALCTGTDSFVGVDVFWNNVRYFSSIDKLVAVGYIQGTYYSPIVAHSTNGISWTLVPIDGAFENGFNTGNNNWRLNDITYIAETQKFVIASTMNNGFGGVFVTSDVTQALDGSNHVAIELNVAKVVPWSVVQFNGPLGYLMLFGEVNGPGGTTEVWYGVSTTDAGDYGQDTSFWDGAIVDQIGYLPEISEVAYDANDFVAVTTDGQVITPAFAMGPYWTVSVPVPYTAAINDIIRNQTDVGRLDTFTTSPLVGSQNTNWSVSVPFDMNVTEGNDVFRVTIDADSVLTSCTLVTGDVHTVGDTIILPGNHFGGDAMLDAITVTVTSVISATTIEFTSTNGQGMAYDETVEKITISGVTSHTENGSTTEQSYNDSYYVKKVTINNVDSYELYVDKECTTPWDTRTYWPVDTDTGTLIWSHGTYFDAAGTSPGYYYIGNDDEQVFRSSNGVTWVQEADVDGMYFNDFAYGTFGETTVNRLSYTDSETGYNSTVVLTYDFDVDVDNAHLNIKGDGSWDIGSSNFRTKIYSAGLEEPTNIIIQANNRYWSFNDAGGLRFPDDTVQTTAYVNRNINLDGGGAAVHFEQEVGFVDGGFSATRHGVADPVFNGGDRLTESNQFNLDGGGA
jgi:hypothetical protein